MDIDVSHAIRLTKAEATWYSGRLQNAIGLGKKLIFPYRIVKQAEVDIRLNLEKTNRPEVRVYGLTGLSHNDQRLKTLLESMFQIYASSACELVRIVASIAEYDKVRRDHYEDDVLGVVVDFKNRDIGHLSGTTQQSHDNEPERTDSSSFQFEWNGNRIVARSLKRIHQQDKKPRESDAIPYWSLTEFHELFCIRYPWLRQPQNFS
ncbi:MAG: hypothetical protein JNL58_05660 [Planctomyces sp.]|nr:hypothetical protein [Planctomyces sp.]